MRRPSECLRPPVSEARSGGSTTFYWRGRIGAGWGGRKVPRERRGGSGARSAEDGGREDSGAERLREGVDGRGTRFSGTAA
ncbi:hypothetical protein GCM10025787_46360 [Saccharopolyspora rosea]